MKLVSTALNCSPMGIEQLVLSNVAKRLRSEVKPLCHPAELKMWNTVFFLFTIFHQDKLHNLRTHGTNVYDRRRQHNVEIYDILSFERNRTSQYRVLSRFIVTGKINIVC